LGVFEVVVPRPEILLLGTGTEMAHPPPSVRAFLAGLGIQVDVMSTVCISLLVLRCASFLHMARTLR
jgi:uncharacterized protein